MKTIICVDCDTTVPYKTKPPKRCAECRRKNKIDHGKRWQTNNPESRRAAVTKQYNKKKQMVEDYKMMHGCADCGYHTYGFVLQFDHVRGVKLFNVGTGVASRSMDDVWKEIAKCEVVCANCHFVRTHNRQKER